MKPFKKFLKSCSEIIFPVTCACCGMPPAGEERYLCAWCKTGRFEYAVDHRTEFTPENILFLYSLWQFDKGGYLQKLLHDLKYQSLQEVGKELGMHLGRMFLRHTDPDLLGEIEEKNPLLVPVPLHKTKKRKRGYNQARALALGIARVTTWPVADETCVIRVKKTKTQTGLNSAERSKNLKDAFAVRNSRCFQHRLPVIVDDVFTTGATTFELAGTILNHRSGKAGILTVAKA